MLIITTYKIKLLKLQRIL